MSKKSTKPFLEASNINFQYGVVPILKDVNFAIERGKILGISGLSGCGKSTILQLVAGFASPDRGEIIMNGKRVSGGKSMLPPHRRGCTMVSQGFSLWSHMTVKKHLQFVMSPKKSAKYQERITETLKFIGLLEKKHCYPHELSGGEQQRLAIGRAVIRPPNYLLLDEPFSNIDNKRRKEMLTFLTALSVKEQTTILYVSHDYHELLELADMVLVLEEKQQLFFGTKDEFSMRGKSGPGTHSI